MRAFTDWLLVKASALEVICLLAFAPGKLLIACQDLCSKRLICGLSVEETTFCLQKLLYFPLVQYSFMLLTALGAVTWVKTPLHQPRVEILTLASVHFLFTLFEASLTVRDLKHSCNFFMLWRHKILIWADSIVQVLFTPFRVWERWEGINRMRYSFDPIFGHWWRHRITTFAHSIGECSCWITIDWLWKVRRGPVVVVEIHRRLFKRTRLGSSSAFLVDFWFRVLGSSVSHQLLHPYNLSCTSLVCCNRS